MSQRVYDENGTPTDASRRHDRRRRRSGTPRSATSSAARGRTAGSRAAPTPATHGAERARHVGAGLRPRRRHPQRARLRRLRRRRLPDRHAGVELGRDGARVRPRHGRARRRVLPSPGTYTGGEPGAPTSRSTRTAPRSSGGSSSTRRRPVPTGISARAPELHRLQPGAKPAGWSDDRRRRPVRGRQYADRAASTARSINCRMRGNSPPYCPVCYTRMKTQCRAVRAGTPS